MRRKKRILGTSLSVVVKTVLPMQKTKFPSLVKKLRHAASYSEKNK